VVPRRPRICLFVRLIMPWRFPAWARITFPVPEILKRFFAPDFVFSLGIWHPFVRSGGLPLTGRREARPFGLFSALGWEQIAAS
jgi:hypothetical protein